MFEAEFWRGQNPRLAIYSPERVVRCLLGETAQRDSREEQVAQHGRVRQGNH
jgi:hypothetical protein